MNPTNESIGRAFLLFVEESARDRFISSDVRNQILSLAHELDRQAPRDLSGEALRLSERENEWLEYAIDHMLDDSEPEDLTCAEVLRKMLDRSCIVIPAPQPPAQEQGEILDTLADAPKWKAMPLYRRLSIHADSCALVCDESKDAVLSKHEIRAMHDDIREAITTLTRAAGAEDARDAERYRWLRQHNLPTNTGIPFIGTFYRACSRWSGDEADRIVDAAIASQAQPRRTSGINAAVDRGDLAAMANDSVGFDAASQAQEVGRE